MAQSSTLGTTSAPITNQNHSNPNSLPMSSISFRKINNRSIDAIYQLTITNNSDIGFVSFEDGSLTMNAIGGQKINVKITINDDRYTLVGLNIYDQANPNISLGSTKESDSIYSFIVPEIKDSNELEQGQGQFFQTGNISIDPIFDLKQINCWTYDYSTQTYNFTVPYDNFVFDDVAYPELQLAPNNSYKLFNIYLNNHNIYIKNLTIPSGVQLMFKNNEENTNNAKVPVIGLTSDSTFNHDSVHGVIGRFGSCQYSDAMAYQLGIPGIY